jgi:integrase/recombinase XerD
MTELRTRMLRDMTLRGFSPRTHKSYIAAVVGLARYYHRAPDQLTNEEVQACLFYLIHDRKRAWSSCNLAASAFRFLYHVTLGHDRADFHVPAPKQPQKLPEILSREEVWPLINTAALPKHRLLLATTYAAGLRVSEVVALKIADIDVERLTIRVEHGKGGKDRYVPLADRLLVELRRGELPMAKQALDGVQIGARFQQVCGVGMAEGVMPPCLRIPARSFVIM